MLTLQSISIKNLGSYEDQLYTFSRNKLKIIVGINKDSLPLELSNSNLEELLNKDLEIPSNGSGKSMIAEALSIALFGEPVRKDVVVRDLIRKGSEFAEISLICCNNLIDADKIEIKRTIYQGKKSASVEIIEYKADGSFQELHRSSIDESNKFIISKYIGISKENY